jgi:hypothetical protein
VPRPTSMWHHRVEGHSSVPVSPSGAFARGFTCRAGSPWQTRTPTPLGGSPRCCRHATPVVVFYLPRDLPLYLPLYFPINLSLYLSLYLSLDCPF